MRYEMMMVRYLAICCTCLRHCSPFTCWDPDPDLFITSQIALLHVRWVLYVCCHAFIYSFMHKIFKKALRMLILPQGRKFAHVYLHLRLHLFGLDSTTSSKVLLLAAHICTEIDTWGRTPTSYLP